MCRWLAYTGAPISLSEVLYTPVHSLIEQSLHSRLGAETTNGDGFGVGWYGASPTPGVFHSTEPAWNDKNLHELADHISSSNFFAHIRAAIGSSVQQTNCHPERELYEEVSEDAHMVVSEPLGEIPGKSVDLR